MKTVVESAALTDNTGRADQPLTQDVNSWCAISPWNGLYYTSSFGGSPENETPAMMCYAFDPRQKWTYAPEHNLVFREADIRSAVSTRSVRLNRDGSEPTFSESDATRSAYYNPHLIALAVKMVQNPQPRY
jgi:hypothetical protein